MCRLTRNNTLILVFLLIFFRKCISAEWPLLLFASDNLQRKKKQKSSSALLANGVNEIPS